MTIIERTGNYLDLSLLMDELDRAANIAEEFNARQVVEVRS